MAAAQNVRSRSIPRTHRRSIPPIHTLLKKQNSFEIWDHLHNFAYLLHSTRPDDKKHSKGWCIFATLFVCLDVHASVYIRLWSFVSTYEIAIDCIQNHTNFIYVGTSLGPPLTRPSACIFLLPEIHSMSLRLLRCCLPFGSPGTCAALISVLGSFRVWNRSFLPI